MIGRRSTYGGKIDKHTLLLLHFDNNIENSGHLKMDGFSGSLSYNTFGKFDACLDITNVFITQQNSSEWLVDLLASGTYTIDFWQSFGFNTILGMKSLEGFQTGFRIAIGYGGTITYGNTSIETGGLSGWNHFEFSSQSGNIHVFVNGKLIHQFNYIPKVTGVFAINAFWYNKSFKQSSNRLLLDEFRISNIARHTSDFTPPNKPY